MKFKIQGIYLIILVLFIGCKKKEEEKPVEVLPPPPQIEVKEPEYETYQYSDMERRDPFVSLEELERIKQEQAKKEREIKVAKPKEEGQVFSLAGLIWDNKDVVGIVEGETENYLFVRDGLKDKEGNPVPDIKGYSKDNGIILTMKEKEPIFLKMGDIKILEE